MKRLVVFDVDDTLVRTDARICVCDLSTGEEMCFTTREWALFSPGEHHEVDYSEFSDVSRLLAGRLVPPVFERLKEAVEAGDVVGVITARDNVDHVVEFLAHHGVAVNPGMVHAVSARAAGYVGATPTRKAEAMRRLLLAGPFSSVTFYEDDERNLRCVSDYLASAGVRAEVALVDPEDGSVRWLA